MQVVCHIPLESSRQGLQNFCKSYLDQRSSHKVVGLQSRRNSTLAILGLSLGSPETKSHLDVGLVERHIIYYKGEGGGFPQVRAMVSLVSSNYLWLVLAPKVLQLGTNHLVLVFVQVRVSS
jgi:hypothetical protein